MAEITAAMVRDLREQTAAGMLECKKALADADGDMKRAVAILREKGAAKAVKRSERAAKEGLIKAALSNDSRKAAMVEVNTETDFSARNERFVAMVDDIANTALATEAADLNALLAAKPVGGADSATVADLVTDLIGIVGENMGVRRCMFMSVPTGKAGIVRAYIHPPGKVGVLVQFECDSEAVASHEAVVEMASNICLQVAFSAPAAIDAASVPQDLVEQERQVFRNTALNEGKPENLVDKIVEGKMKSFYKESCLLEQSYVKDEKMSISDLIQQSAKAAGGSVQLVAFIRYQLGEGDE